MFKRSSIVIAILAFSAFSSAQQGPGDERAKLEKDAVELLRETSVEVGRLRTLENRISFNSELASLMWFHDDKEARAMYAQVVGEFKELLSQFDAEMNIADQPDDEEYSRGFLFGGYGRSKVERKFQIAMAVRKQIAMSLAEHAPDLAYNFYFDSINAVTNPKLREQAQQGDKYFESQLMQQIAMANAAKGVEYGRESMKGGVQGHHIELLKKIYEKDADKGIEFGADLLARLRVDKSKQRSYLYDELLSFASSSLENSVKPGGKKPVYTASEVRDIAELFAQAILEGDTVYEYQAGKFAERIGKYAPARAAQIRTKFVKDQAFANSNIAELETLADLGGPGANSAAANSNAAAVRMKEEQEAREKREKELMEGITKVGSKELPKEERDKLIARARAIVAATPGKDKKIGALSMLAAQVARAGDRELAEQIMLDADRLVNPQPKNYRDFLMSAMLAAGYAEVDPEKAFPLLESTILRANDTLSAFIKVAEFIDVNGEMVDDGEIQVGMFGGEMIRGITGEIGMANSTVRSLAMADFGKTRNLTNTFDRTEVRVLAKMLVLRAVLDKNGADKPADASLLDQGEDAVR